MVSDEENTRELIEGISNHNCNLSYYVKAFESPCQANDPLQWRKLSPQVPLKWAMGVWFRTPNSKKLFITVVLFFAHRIVESISFACNIAGVMWLARLGERRGLRALQLSLSSITFSIHSSFLKGLSFFSTCIGEVPES